MTVFSSNAATIPKVAMLHLQTTFLFHHSIIQLSCVYQWYPCHQSVWSLIMRKITERNVW